MGYLDKIKDSVKEDLKEISSKRSEIEGDKEDEILEKAVEFYNNTDIQETEIFYTDEGTPVLYFFTPEKRVDKEGNTLNKFKVFDSYSGDKNYLLSGCRFMIDGNAEFLSVFATKEQWAEIAGPARKVYERQVFATGSLKKRYKLLVDSQGNVKPKDPAKFLKYYNKKYDANVEKIEDIDASEYQVYHSTNIWQVLESAER